MTFDETITTLLVVGFLALLGGVMVWDIWFRGD